MEMVRIIAAAITVQVQQTRRDIEDLLPLLTMPLFTLIFMAILDFLGRKDLSSFAIVAPLLLTIGQMGIFVAREMIVRERAGQTLEMLVASPAPFAVIIISRIGALPVLGLVGFLESWLLATLLFGANITIHHPLLLIIALVLTIAAATTTALIASAVICFSRSTRTLQNSIAFPLFLISGVLVPVTFLPDWLEPLSRIIFLYWSANLLRDSMQSGAPADVALNLTALAGLAVLAGVLGTLLINRMLTHLKQEGTLGL